MLLCEIAGESHCQVQKYSAFGAKCPLSPNQVLSAWTPLGLETYSTYHLNGQFLDGCALELRVICSRVWVQPSLWASNYLADRQQLKALYLLLSWWISFFRCQESVDKKRCAKITDIYTVWCFSLQSFTIWGQQPEKSVNLRYASFRAHAALLDLRRLIIQISEVYPT